MTGLSLPKLYLEVLRGAINGPQRDAGPGLALNGPVLHEILESSNLLAAATTSYYDESKDVKTYPGLDLLTGERQPQLGRGPGGVMIGHDFVGGFAAALSDLAVLATRPVVITWK